MRRPATTAIEVDSRLVDASRRVLAHCGRPGGAVWGDVLEGFAAEDADVALVLKTLPCLERQQAGGALALLRALADVPAVVVSYPVRSLGGFEKGMRDTYRADLERLAEQAGRGLAVLPLDGELTAVLAQT